MENANPGNPAEAGAWRILPLTGTFTLSYVDAGGAASLRRVSAQELKIGPGKLLLGGIDGASGDYRGFRADRIRLIADDTTGQTIDRNVVDWLLARAEREARDARRRKPKAYRVAA